MNCSIQTTVDIVLLVFFLLLFYNNNNVIDNCINMNLLSYNGIVMVILVESFVHFVHNVTLLLNFGLLCSLSMVHY